ncbi:MAG: hypothetical protein ACLTKG_02505 [Collinsella intestinalis]
MGSELNEGVKRIYTEMGLPAQRPGIHGARRDRVQLTLENNIVARTVRRSEALEDNFS